MLDLEILFPKFSNLSNFFFYLRKINFTNSKAD